MHSEWLGSRVHKDVNEAIKPSILYVIGSVESRQISLHTVNNDGNRGLEAHTHTGFENSGIIRYGLYGICLRPLGCHNEQYLLIYCHIHGQESSASYVPERIIDQGSSVCHWICEFDLVKLIIHSILQETSKSNETSTNYD